MPVCVTVYSPVEVLNEMTPLDVSTLKPLNTLNCAGVLSVND